jgi:hypothetical protein
MELLDIIAFVSSLVLFLAAISLLFRQSWGRRLVIAMPIVMIICAFVNIIGDFASGHIALMILFLASSLWLLIVILPLVILTRPTVKAWFDYQG